MMLDNFAKSGFDVFAGSESFLLANMKNGGAGCISATANVNPAAIDKLYREWQKPDAEAQQQALDVVRGTFGNSKYLMIAALKAGIAQYSNDDQWCTVRPPLVELNKEQRASLAAELAAIAFKMPGLPQAQPATA